MPKHFAFKQLKCVHFEIAGRNILKLHCTIGGELPYL